MTVYIGIDVSKRKFDCAWLRDPDRVKVKTKVFGNDTAGHAAVLDWLAQQTGTPADQIHIIMEATGIYHEALAQALYEAGLGVSVMNPAQVREFAKSLGVRGKNDRKDSVVLARYGAARRPRLWQPEPAAVRGLKARLARLEALDKDIQRERNRREKAEVVQAEEIIASIDTVLDALRAERDRLTRDIDDHFDRHPALKKDRALLESVPGIGPTVSRRLLATLRSRDFTSARQAAAFIGVIPVPWDSGSSVHGPPRLSKAGNPKLRQLLYMAAIVSTKHNPDIAAQYQRLTARGKSDMSALGGAMRKLVHLAYGVLKHQTPYQPQGAT
ncbi:IS110 family transposase [Salinisphaera sp. LB1]|uniref:IS110 family transposase n=1 Tax=Salinisphaera sp. LB1 TaxID=2183911 RepID=UPI000D70528F|nr:IS110 family transposase [Salinisphaera sp. LB1]